MEYSTSNKNFQILTAAERIGWKIARKTKGMLGTVLNEPLDIIALEGPQTVPAGAMLCIGASGEAWGQKVEKVEQKYVLKGRTQKIVSVPLQDGSKKEFSDMMLFEPKPDRTVLACQINQPFTVHAPWATLNGKAGDFIVKPSDDADNPDPQDVWIVAQRLFNATYSFE